MKSRKYSLFVLLLLSGSIAAQAQQNELGWTMDSAVRQLDRQGDDFNSVLAQVEVDWSGAGESPEDIESGRIYINKDGDFRVSTDEPRKMTVLRRGRTLSYYDPEAAHVDEYSLSKHKDRLEVFIPLGFSTTGKDMDKDFLVTFIGEKTIGDRRTLGLELTPKRDDARAVMSRMELWVDQASWLPARQVITKPGGDTLTVSYSGTARNLKLNPDLFHTNWPRGTTKVRK